MQRGGDTPEHQVTIPRPPSPPGGTARAMPPSTIHRRRFPSVRRTREDRPVANTFVTSADDRRIGLFAAGDPGSPRLVVVCHPSPGSATLDPDPTVTDKWGVHLVALDRPGYGTSDLLPPGVPHRIADRADDVTGYLERAERSAADATRTDLGTIGVVGWGTGALVAAAIAASRPELVDRLALIGPPAPRTAAKLARRAFIADPSLAALHLDRDDPDFARHLGLSNRVERMIGDAFTQGRAGVEADRLLMADESWISDLKRITADTRIWLGARDPSVDEDDVRWWGRRVQGAKAVHVRDTGPLTIASAWRHVLAHVAPKEGSLEQQERDEQGTRIAAVDPAHPDRG
jgi:pimeloyl-ACP methyl ester carboxylesterase